MKTLYLYDSDKGWLLFEYRLLFEYNVLSDLAHEFSIRTIQMGYGCELGNDCELGDGCKLGDSCELGNGCKVKHTLCIHASRHTITYWGCDAIQIGCKQYTISKWLSNYEKIGRSINYSDKEIEEYWMYIDMIKHIHESGALM